MWSNTLLCGRHWSQPQRRTPYAYGRFQQGGEIPHAALWRALVASTALSTHKVLLRTRRGDAQRCPPQREAVWQALACYAKVGEPGAVAVLQPGPHFMRSAVAQPQPGVWLFWDKRTRG